jgi:hypothetical protein
MSAIYPVTFRWDGSAMIPLAPGIAGRQYVVGETYRLIQQEERSHQSHAHFFASIMEVWQNLPEHLTKQFPTAEHLRKFALIKAGYSNARSIAVSSEDEAQRLVAFMQPLDDYAIVTATEFVVTVHTAKSQSMKAMAKDEFQKSKEAVVGIVAQMIGTTPELLQRNAGRAA